MHINRIRKTGSPGPVEATRIIGGTAGEKLRFYGWTVDKNGCWLWNGSASHGYGQVMFDGQMRLTHRLSYAEWVGEIPDGMVVCHRCDVPRCMNPEHLFLGAQSDNLADMVEKKRHSHGEARYNARLTDAEVLRMRMLRSEAVPVSEIVAQFGVSKRQVYKIVNGEQWKHLNGITQPDPERKPEIAS